MALMMFSSVQTSRGDTWSSVLRPLWDKDESIYLRDFIVRNETFSVEHFSRLSGCGAAVKEAKTVGGGDTQAVLILGTHKLRWHVHRHDGRSLGCGTERVNGPSALKWKSRQSYFYPLSSTARPLDKARKNTRLYYMR
ncbi:hypothetical protein QTP88_022277 [Uroleucon formosanum]